MRVTAVINPKGGTGKTTTVVNIAAAAAFDGQRVVLIDLDKQGSATTWLGSTPYNHSLPRTLTEGSPCLGELLVPTPVPGLELVPGSVELADTSRITKEPGHQMLLKEALAGLPPVDWVLLDTPGDLGPLTIMGMTAASDVLIPVSVGSLELDEVPKIRATVDKVQARLNPALSIAGVLVVRVRIHGRHQSVLARDVTERLRQDFPGQVLEAVVRDDARHGQAPAWRQPMAVFDPGGKGDIDYRGVLAELRAQEMVSVR